MFPWALPWTDVHGRVQRFPWACFVDPSTDAGRVHGHREYLRHVDHGRSFMTSSMEGSMEIDAVCPWNSMGRSMEAPMDMFAGLLEDINGTLDGSSLHRVSMEPPWASMGFHGPPWNSVEPPWNLHGAHRRELHRVTKKCPSTNNKQKNAKAPELRK